MSISSINGVSGTVSRYRYVSSGGETSVSGSDANGNTINYLVGKEEVYLNGVLLVRGQDYTATDGVTISSLTALVSGDTMEIITFAPYSIPTALSSSVVTNAGDLIIGTAASTVTNLPIGTSGQLLQSNGTTAAWATVSTKPYTSTAISGATTAVAFNNYFVNTASAVTVTLPSSPNLGDEIRIFDATGSAATNNITVAPAGSTGYNYIQGSNQNLAININYGGATLLFTGTTYGWKVA